MFNNIEDYQKTYNRALRKHKSRILTGKDKIRNCLVEEMNQNKLMSKKHKKFCRVLNYIDHLRIVISTITGCVSIFAFTSLVGIPIGITSSAIGLKTCTLTAGNLISKVLIDSNISHDEFV